MINLAVNDELAAVGRRLALLSERRIRQDVAHALQLTVTAARDQLRSDLADPAGPVEGGATRWTIGGTYASRFVRPDDLTAAVGFASDQPRAAGRYLRPIMRGTGPVTKGIDLRLTQGRRGQVFIPSSSLPRTPQGNVSRAVLRSQVVNPDLKLFTRPLRGGSGLGLYARSSERIRGTSTYESRLRFLGVLKPGRTRRQTLELAPLLNPTIEREFSKSLAADLQRSLTQIGFS
jgi:hypothetical protein